MSKYIIYEQWDKIPTGYYQHYRFKGYRFECGLSVDRNTDLYGNGKFYYLDETGARIYDKEEFKRELKFRSTKLWKALYSSK